MERIAEGQLGQRALPKFEDGAINMQELNRGLAEQVANGIMDAKADQH